MPGRVENVLKLLNNMIRSAMNEAMDKAFTRAIRDQYIENIFEMVPVSKKVGPIPLMELTMRSAHGTPVPRPLGSHIHFSPWEQLLFNPVHLYRFPTPEKVGIGTSVTIGPQARKPLTIAVPIMIAGMSFGGALSKSAKLALAKAATAVGTATNSGEAGLLREEREAASLFIGQYNRGGWMNTPDKYRLLDAIEIQLGQGAQGSAPQRTTARNIGEDFREVYGLREGEDAVISSRLPDVNTKEDFVQLVRRLQSETGVPVGLKFAATHHLERELAIAAEAGVDFVTVDGAEGGTHGGAPTLQDDVGLPTLYAVSRAARYLVKHRLREKISLIASGGLVTPGQMLKAMALGANAVYTGTAAVMALVGDQMVKSLPYEPPTSLIVYTGKMTDHFDVDQGVKNLVNFLNATVREMELVAYSLGKTALADITASDLCTLDPFVAMATGVELGYVAPGEQQQFFSRMERMLPFMERSPQPEQAGAYPH